MESIELSGRAACHSFNPFHFNQRSLRQLIHKFAFMKSNLLDLLLACRAIEDGLVRRFIQHNQFTSSLSLQERRRPFKLVGFIPLSFLGWFNWMSLFGCVLFSLRSIAAAAATNPQLKEQPKLILLSSTAEASEPELISLHSFNFLFAASAG